MNAKDAYYTALEQNHESNIRLNAIDIYLEAKKINELSETRAIDTEQLYYAIDFLQAAIKELTQAIIREYDREARI